MNIRTGDKVEIMNKESSHFSRLGKVVKVRDRTYQGQILPIAQIVVLLGEKNPIRYVFSEYEVRLVFVLQEAGIIGGDMR